MDLIRVGQQLDFRTLLKDNNKPTFAFMKSAIGHMIFVFHVHVTQEQTEVCRTKECHPYESLLKTRNQRIFAIFFKTIE